MRTGGGSTGKAAQGQGFQEALAGETQVALGALGAEGRRCVKGVRVTSKKCG